MHAIDFHTHVFPDELAARALPRLRPYSPLKTTFTDGTVTGLIQSMDRAGIDIAVSLPVATRESQVATINRNARSAASNKRLAPFAALYPRMAAFEEEVNSLHAAGICGVKLHPEYQNFHVDDPAMNPIYECLVAKRLLVVFHVGKAPGPGTRDRAHPAALRAVHRRFPLMRMVATHMGGYLQWDEAENELVGLPIYLDTAAVANFLPDEQFVRIVRRHGAQRVLFGTDSPWFDQLSQKIWLESLPLDDSEKEAILFANAARLLELA